MHLQTLVIISLITHESMIINIWWLNLCQFSVLDLLSNLTGGIDYIPGPFNVTIPAGVTSAPLDVIIVDDDLVEAYETFTLYIDQNSLSNDVERIYPYSISVTIVDDDSELII